MFTLTITLRVLSQNVAPDSIALKASERSRFLPIEQYLGATCLSFKVRNTLVFIQDNLNSHELGNNLERYVTMSMDYISLVDAPSKAR